MNFARLDRGVAVPLRHLQINCNCIAVRRGKMTRQNLAAQVAHVTSMTEQLRVRVTPVMVDDRPSLDLVIGTVIRIIEVDIRRSGKVADRIICANREGIAHRAGPTVTKSITVHAR